MEAGLRRSGRGAGGARAGSGLGEGGLRERGLREPGRRSRRVRPGNRAGHGAGVARRRVAVQPRRRPEAARSRPRLGCQRPVGCQPGLIRRARRAGRAGRASGAGWPCQRAVVRRLRRIGVKRPVRRYQRAVGSHRGPVVLVGHSVVGPDVVALVAPAEPPPSLTAVAALAAAAALALIAFGSRRQVVPAGVVVIAPIATVLPVAIAIVRIVAVSAFRAAGPLGAVVVVAGVGFGVAAAVRVAPRATGTVSRLGASGPPALDALGGEVLVGGPVIVVLVIVGRVVVAVVVITGFCAPSSVGFAATPVRPRVPTTKKRHSTPPGKARPCGGASEAHAAIYASLPPLSRAPLTGTGAGSIDF